MRYVAAGGERVSAIGLGTWQFGSRDWGYGSDYATRTAADLVQHALDAGVNLIDTAEVYGFGNSERIVGAAVAGRHDEAFVATKLFPVMPLEKVVVRQARASADRLGYRPIDLYQLHWPNPVVPLGTTLAGMRTVLDDGTVAQVGVSNHSADRWYEVERRLGRPVVSNQVAYNLVDRRAERQILGYAQARDRIVIAYSPLAQGLLGGRYDADH
ncbi:MAG: aldo/keto reductase, partial [Acidimicrobiia bacterium]|nr:aldo/keto reductase [Acidimicrobiia bacterium]